MRSIATCYSEHAIKVSDSYCSGSSNLSNYLTPKLSSSSSSIPREVTCIYKTNLSNQKQLLITLTWFSNLTAGIRIGSGDESSMSTSTSEFRRLKKDKGHENFKSSCGYHKVEVIWDFSKAKYEGGPEPVQGFYVLVLVDSELGLVLGHKDDFEEEKNIIGQTKGKFWLVCRSERLISCNAFYATKAQFCDDGIEHDIVIKCGRDQDGDEEEEEEEGQEKHNNNNNNSNRNPVLFVCIDKKTMFKVKRLRWNFRGNQAIFLDGVLVDMMWDVHDWFFNTSGCAVFMFRTRKGLNSRLWLEETAFLKHNKDQTSAAAHEFSLLISACKNPE
ncbi:hypothetical protein TIFTF001_008583 [Ficus carica]|uniref:DUF868 family protein n=1 Tax=Ficus carica TaxID=3494 RepID=A0AA87ZLN6_FICCA|nr:hypothetical protein TIFTF001_008583 [Ficus carica]